MKTTPIKSVRKAKSPNSLGKLTPKQKQILVMLASEAFKVQDPGISFNDWRHEQVMDAVQKDGISDCNQEHYSELMGHFLTAAGRETEALGWFLKNGQNHQRQLAWKICKSLEDHTFLAHATVEQLTSSVSPRSLRRRLAKREALRDHPDGHITYDYLLSIVRDKTQRPCLTLTCDLTASLADRCSVTELHQILYTLTNRIAEREGTGLTSDRNKSQKTTHAKAARSPHTLAQRF
jgi:hypothetical protein